MRTRPLGNSDLHISLLGFGAGTIEDLYVGRPAGRPAAIDRALGMGVNWIVSMLGQGAPGAMGRSRSARPYIFTRCIQVRSTKEGPEASVPRDAGSIRQACTQAHGQFETSTIDLYQIDWPSQGPSTVYQAAWQAMADLQQDGMVRWIGLVDCGIEQLRAAHKIAPVTALQIRLSLLDTAEQRETLAFCRDNGIGVLGALPVLRRLARGSRYEAGTRMRWATTLGICTQEEWHRDRKAHDSRLDHAFSVLDECARIGSRPERSADTIAAAWALRLPGVTGIVLDDPSVEEVPMLVGDGEFHLSDEEFARIQAARS